jgi:chromosome condensin MukBEF ATPase and DNA-binding subunit MukB
MAAIVDEMRELQARDASVPNVVDDLDPRLPALRVELDEIDRRLQHLHGLSPAQLAGGERQRLAQQLEQQAGALTRKIRAVEAELLTALEAEEEGSVER